MNQFHQIEDVFGMRVFADKNDDISGVEHSAHVNALKLLWHALAMLP